MFYRGIGSTMAVKNGRLGYNESIFMPLISADALGFLVAL